MSRAAPAFENIEVAGHRFAALDDGPGTLDRLIALIDGARREVRLLYYIFADDAAGRRVRQALLDAAGRGVRVWLMVDGFGSEATDEDFFTPLERADKARVCRFQPRFGRRYLLRNHQKMAIADDDRVIVGGFNIEDDYFATGPDSWRDFGIEVTGPSIDHLVRYYQALFDWSTDRRATLRGMRRLIRGSSQTKGSVRWLIGGPTLRPSRLVVTLRDDMRDARRLDMIMAYFAPNPALLRRLGRIARRGMARIVTAARSDNRVTIGAARHCYYRLLRGGVAISEYQPAKLHEKLIAIDDIGYVGSANFDMRSLYLNLELMLRVEDVRFADAVRGRIERAAQRSERIDWDRYRELATPWRKMLWTIHYFIVAVLDFGVSRGLNARG